MEKITTKPKLGALYIRESTEGQDLGFSPQKQENDLKDYAKRNNINIVAEYKDLVSGTKASKRIEFQKMMLDAQNHKFEIILVFHTSRFARNVKEARKYKEYLREELNIDVISINQNFGDWNDPNAFLNEGINELFDAYYSKQLGFWMRKAFAEKRTQGYPLGNCPLGYYKKKGNTKDWFVEKDEARIVREIFKKYATGKYSMSDLANYLNEKGYKTKLGNVFTHTSLKDIMKNVIYTGFIPIYKQDIPPIKGKHQAIINKELYNKVQKQRKERRHSFGRPVAPFRFYLLQGLVYCYYCFKHIKGKEDAKTHDLKPKMYCHAQPDRKGKELRHYSCKYRRENKSCKQSAVPCEIIDKQVLKYMENLVLPDYIIQDIIKRLEKIYNDYKEDTKEKDKINELKAKKKRINVMYEMNQLSDQEYVAKLKDVENQLSIYEDMGMDGKSIMAKKKLAMSITEKFLREFKMFWNLKNLPKEEKREWILLSIKRVWVKDKKVIAIEPKDDFKALFSSIKAYGHCPLVAPEKRGISLFFCLTK